MEVPGGSRSLQQGRPVMTECLLDHRLDLVRRLGPESKDSSRLGHLWQNRVARTGPKSGMPAAFIFNSTKANELLLKTINFTGNFN
jgi:hypothetical protein